MQVHGDAALMWAMPAVAERLGENYERKGVFIDCATWMTMWKSFERLFNAGYSWITFGKNIIIKGE